MVKHVVSVNNTPMPDGMGFVKDTVHRDNDFDPVVTRPGIENLYDWSKFLCHSGMHLGRNNKEVISSKDDMLILFKLSGNNINDGVENHGGLTHLQDIIVHRTQNELPTKVIVEDVEGYFTDKYIDDIKRYFTNLNLDIDNNLFILNHNLDTHNLGYYGLKNNILYYNWCYADSYFWKQYKPEKFTDLELKHRPQLVNLLASKLKSKSVRAEVIYEFYKQKLLPKTLLGINGNIDVFKNYFPRELEFLKIIESRIAPLNGVQINYLPHGTTNLENGCETSNRVIYTNSILSCVLETAGCSLRSTDIIRQTANLTEKFFRSVVNYTPYIVFGGDDCYDAIKKFKFHTFEDIVSENISEIYNDPNCINRIQKITSVTKKFLKIIPKNFDRVQEKVNDNYNMWESRAKEEFKLYTDTISDFINKQ